ncbi:MAG: hypothetical protein EBS90_10675, partial [Betaproteobacteria bacterium]|nr:hypothetical protein [Betaproteobacteria bacterium]
ARWLNAKQKAAIFAHLQAPIMDIKKECGVAPDTDRAITPCPVAVRHAWNSGITTVAGTGVAATDGDLLSNIQLQNTLFPVAASSDEPSSFTIIPGVGQADLLPHGTHPCTPRIVAYRAKYFPGPTQPSAHDSIEEHSKWGAWDSIPPTNPAVSMLFCACIYILRYLREK